MEPHFNWVLNDKVAAQRYIPTYTWQNYCKDPRSLLIKLARYKFVAKVLHGKSCVVEVGCGDGFGAPIVKQEVRDLTLKDVDPMFLQMASDFLSEWSSISVRPFREVFGEKTKMEVDALYALDVLEHVPKDQENSFFKQILRPLKPRGMAVFGVPSPEAQRFTSEANKLGHVNVQSVEALSSVLRGYFENVINFGMNDEVVHTGFVPMRSYSFFVCTGVLSKSS